MRPQKPKRRNNKIRKEQQIRSHGYYLDDISCKCVNYKGKKRGCILSACDFEEEKLDAIKYSRIKRKGGDAV